MMAHHSPQERLIMAISLQEQLKMLFVDMPAKPVIMFLEDSVGIVTDFLLNIKLINNLKLLIKGKFYKWESLNTTNNAEKLS
jgi:hypothetical protein